MKYKNSFFYLILICLALLFNLKSLKSNFDSQGKTILSEFSLNHVVTGETILFPQKKRMLIVFWATWCPPCKIELARIDNLIRLNRVDPRQVLAISLDERLKDLLPFVREQNYLFPVAHDSSGQIRSYFKILGTPTLVLIDDNNIINWQTTGLSPSLELRLLNFLKTDMPP